MAPRLSPSTAPTSGARAVDASEAGLREHSREQTAVRCPSEALIRTQPLAFAFGFFTRSGRLAAQVTT